MQEGEGFLSSLKSAQNEKILICAAAARNFAINSFTLGGFSSPLSSTNTTPKFGILVPVQADMSCP
jgi:hypothetical protein